MACRRWRWPLILLIQTSLHARHDVQEAQFVDWAFLKRIALTGCMTAGVTLSAFAYEWYTYGNLAAP